MTKFNATIDSVARIPDMLRQAFPSRPCQATPGPVHLQFRGNAGQLDQETAEMDTVVEPCSPAAPPFRPSRGRPLPPRSTCSSRPSAHSSLPVAAFGRRARDRNWSRWPSAWHPGRDLTQWQGLDSGPHPLLGRRRRHLLPA